MDLGQAGKQEYKFYIVWRDPNGVRDERVSTGRGALSSAVEPGRG
jgi:hypothetical protein